MADLFKFVQSQSFALAGGGAVTGATSITLKSLVGIDGALLTMTDFGAIGFGTLEPGNGILEEQISFTGITQNANGTATLTGVSNVSFVSPYTATSGLSKTHAGSTTFIISNTSGFYDRLTGKADDETITGLWDFPSGANNPTIGAGVYVAPTLDTQIATKKYVDTVAVSGAPNANTTTKGIVQEATQAQVDAKTQAGSTGAELFINPSNARSTLLNDYVADTGAANAYAISPSPSVSAFIAGQRFSFKVKTTNTTVSTLAVNALSATAIFKENGATNLAAGDIVAGQIVEVEYNGVNGFQLMTPSGNSAASQAFVTTSIASAVHFGGSGADGALSVSSGNTNIDCGAAAVFVKNYTSISITGTGSITFTNPNANGTIVIIKSQGNVTLTSSAAPMIDASGVGAAGGAGVSAGPSVDGLPGSNGRGYDYSTLGGSGGVVTSPGGAAGGAWAITNAVYATFNASAELYRKILVGSGGGAGGCITGGNINNGSGGRGGGALIIECKGSWNFTTAGGISVAGKNGVNGGVGGGGGGGGSGGMFLALYNTLTASSGTVTVAGGTGANTGTLSGFGASGGAGGGFIVAGSAGSTSSSNGVKVGGDGAVGNSTVTSNTSLT